MDVFPVFFSWFVLDLMTGECFDCEAEDVSSGCTDGCASCVCTKCMGCLPGFFLDVYQCKPCSRGCLDSTCVDQSGFCSRGCIKGFYGDQCDTPCPDCKTDCGRFGDGCQAQTTTKRTPATSEVLFRFGAETVTRESKPEVYIMLAIGLVFSLTVSVILVNCRHKLFRFPYCCPIYEPATHDPEVGNLDESEIVSLPVLAVAPSSPPLPTVASPVENCETPKDDLPPSYESLFPETFFISAESS